MSIFVILKFLRLAECLTSHIYFQASVSHAFREFPRVRNLAMPTFLATFHRLNKTLECRRAHRRINAGQVVTLFRSMLRRHCFPRMEVGFNLVARRAGCDFIAKHICSQEPVGKITPFQRLNRCQKRLFCGWMRISGQESTSELFGSSSQYSVPAVSKHNKKRSAQHHISYA
jgi:hypothetical protein